MANTELIKEKVEIFYKRGTKIHVVLKKVSNFTKFYNGQIKNIGSNFFVLNDDKLKEIPIHFEDVYYIEVFG